MASVEDYLKELRTRVPTEIAENLTNIEELYSKK